MPQNAFLLEVLYFSLLPCEFEEEFVLFSVPQAKLSSDTKIFKQNQRNVRAATQSVPLHAPPGMSVAPCSPKKTEFACQNLATMTEDETLADAETELIKTLRMQIVHICSYARLILALGYSD